MRSFLFILIAWFGISVSAAEASEVLLGVVASVKRDQGAITLKVIDTSGGGEGNSSPESIVITADPDKIPASLSPGDTVHVWGEYAGSGGVRTFRADTIRKKGSGGNGSDPTGVRSRLGQGQGKGQGSGQGAGGRQSGRR